MSRTAALSRYLAALDAPVAVDDGDLSKQSWQSSVGPNRQQSVGAEERTVLTLPNNMQQQQTQRKDPVPEILSTKSMDERDGHRVVAVPPALGMSVKELVSNKNKLPDGRPRSLSTGRATPRGSRDIVQEVYDRMGVNYTSNNRPTAPSRNSRDIASTNTSRPTTPSQNANFSSRSITPSRIANRADQDPFNLSSSNDRASSNDKFSQKYRSAASYHLSPEPINSSGAEEKTTPSSDPARPVSRGRVSGGRWPPVGATQSPGEAEPQSAESKAFFPVTNPVEKRAPPNNNKKWKKSKSTSPTPSINVAGQSSEAVSDNNKDNTNKEDTSSDEDHPEMPPLGSVKDKLSAFTAPKPKRNFNRTVPNVYGRKNVPPPKIDIYSELKESGPDENTEPNSPPPEPIAKEDNGKDLHKWKSPTAQSKAKNPGPSKVPVSEVASPEDTSVVSGLSAEESYLVSPRIAPPAFPFNKNRMATSSSGSGFGRPAQERNKVAAYQSFTPKARNALGKTSNHKDIDKIVEERVNAQMKDLETHLAMQMQKLETRMEEQMKARMDYMESKIDSRMDDLQSMLYNLIQGKGGTASSNYRNEI